MSKQAQRGATTIYFLLFTILFFGFLVMAADFGRLYLIQGELQTAADAAAIAAATHLSGTMNATTDAADQITTVFDSTTGNDNRFNLRLNQISEAGGSDLITTTTTDYFASLLDARSNVNGGQTGGIDWGSGTYPKYVRVQLTAQAPVLFLPLLNRTANPRPTVVVSAIAGLSAPICSACGIDGFAVVDQSGGTDPINYGLTLGTVYSLNTTTNNLNAATPLIQYTILNHIPVGPVGLDDIDGALFEIGAGGFSSAAGLDPPAPVSVDATEAIVPVTVRLGNGTTSRDILCGLNIRFAGDPSTGNCAAIAEFATLGPLFTADTDQGGGADPPSEDYSTEYSGNGRRVLTVAVVDAVATLTVLNFRQFLIEPATATSQGVNTAAANAAFRAQYIGSPVPLKCGGIGGLCTITSGPGRTVLH